MHNQELNLTRKWRSKTFKTIVGQDLTLRILQNSLYLGQFFPVYLFSGQKGCGKTTTARVFAAAVNCDALSEFQKNPQTILPCLQCTSCLAMQKNQHPDFIEIDAASYTGVDNIRNIIDAASFLPLLGKKKIYLIDEAHMLSKAAFNAFLKLLEEPPIFVMFILATTDAHKILDTVLSRCFQVFFDPIATQKTAAHLAMICQTEKIPYEQAALELISKETQGSLRDALNLLEQVRFAAKTVELLAVQEVLGHVDQDTLVHLMHSIIKNDAQAVLSIAEKLQNKSHMAEYVWQQLIKLMYDIILAHHKVAPRNYPIELLEAFMQTTSLSPLLYTFDMLCEYEDSLSKTSRKDLALEVALLRLLSIWQSNSSYAHTAASVEIVKKKSYSHEWESFIEKIAQESDLVLVSLFKQASFIYDEQNELAIGISFLKKFEVFKDVLEEKAKIWQKHFYVYFPQDISINYQFDKVIEKAKPQETDALLVPGISHKIISPTPSFGTNYKKQKEKVVDVSDAQRWKVAHMLQEHFKGTFIDITEEKS